MSTIQRSIYHSKYKTDIKSIPDSSWAVQNIEFHGNMEVLIQEFTEGKVVMVGDGSFCMIKEIGAGAFIVSSSNMHHYIMCGGPTPGPYESQSAYRSELGTIVGMAIMSTVLTSSLTSSTPPVVISCDNDSALFQPVKDSSSIHARHLCSDLVSLAHDLWRQSNTTPILRRVKGHADNAGR